MFEGFQQRSFDFLWELKLNNERSWFLDHKQEFEDVLNRPLHALAEEVTNGLRERFPTRDFQIHVSRIYRDARRLFGKGPYFDSMWFTIEEGSSRERRPRLHFHIDPGGYSHGLNYWDAPPIYAEAFRRTLDTDPQGFQELIRSLPDREHSYLDGEEYRRPKRDLGALLNPWYNRKTLNFGYEDYFGDLIYEPFFPSKLTAAYAELLPLYDYLREIYLRTVPQDREKGVSG